MTVSKSALTNAKTPIQRKRLLSVAAAIEDDRERAAEGGERRRGWREKGEGEGEEVSHDEVEEEGTGAGDLPLKRLDSETGQTIMGVESKESGEEHLLEQKPCTKYYTKVLLTLCDKQGFNLSQIRIY